MPGIFHLHAVLHDAGDVVLLEREVDARDITAGVEADGEFALRLPVEFALVGHRHGNASHLVSGDGLNAPLHIIPVVAAEGHELPQLIECAEGLRHHSHSAHVYLGGFLLRGFVDIGKQRTDVSLDGVLKRLVVDSVGEPEGDVLPPCAGEDSHGEQ